MGLMTCRCYRPKAIVEYRRQAYIAKENQIRLTLDSQIAATESCYDLFSPRLPLSLCWSPTTWCWRSNTTAFLLSYLRDLLNEVERSELSVSNIVWPAASA